MGKVTFALLSWWLLQERAGSIPDESGFPGPRQALPWPAGLACPMPQLVGLRHPAPRPFPHFLRLLSVTQGPGPGSAEVVLGQCGRTHSGAWPGSQAPSPARCPQGPPPSFVQALLMGWFFLGFWSGWRPPGFLPLLNLGLGPPAWLVFIRGRGWAGSPAWHRSLPLEASLPRGDWLVMVHLGGGGEAGG